MKFAVMKFALGENSLYLLFHDIMTALSIGSKKKELRIENINLHVKKSNATS